MLSPQELRRQLVADPLSAPAITSADNRLKELLDALSDPENPRSRQAAAAMLGRVGGPQAIQALIAALHDPVEAVSVAATRSLGQLRSSEAVPSLLTLLKHGDLAHRRSAAEALGDIGDLRAVDPLVAALEDSSHRVCVAALRALGRIGDRRAVDALVAALAHRDICTRLTAAAALNEIAGPTRSRDRPLSGHPPTSMPRS
jgi:HEAT repeat protein